MSKSDELQFISHIQKELQFIIERFYRKSCKPTHK